jgi:type IV pilus assembly protein PilE
MKSTGQSGITLIELVIVVLIVSLLAAIALPIYDEQVRKSRRGDAAGGLKAVANALERHFTMNTTYASATLGCNATDTFVNTTPIDEACQGGGATAYYNLSISASTVTTYTIQAAPTGAQAGDRCGTLTLTHAGVKGVTGADPGVTWDQCWR